MYYLSYILCYMGFCLIYITKSTLYNKKYIVLGDIQ